MLQAHGLHMLPDGIKHRRSHHASFCMHFLNYSWAEQGQEEQGGPTCRCSRLASARQKAADMFCTLWAFRYPVFGRWGPVQRSTMGPQRYRVMVADSGRAPMISSLNLFSWNISRASLRVTTTRWKLCFSLMICKRAQRLSCACLHASP